MLKPNSLHLQELFVHIWKNRSAWMVTFASYSIIIYILDGHLCKVVINIHQILMADEITTCEYSTFGAHQMA